MRRFRLLGATLLALCFLSAPIIPAANNSALPASSQSDKKEVKVWVNTKSGVYHCPGARWYGTTKEGKYMSECEAQKAGYRPAYGKPCGSDCVR
jgi:hypothetical protein